VLRTAHEALEKELKRIEDLLTLNDERMLGKYLGKIREAFFKRIGDARKDFLVPMESAIDRGQPADLDEAWKLSIHLRTNVLPPLSSELLALIGGAYLQEKQLDSVKQQADQARPAQESDLSFSQLSQDLVTALAQHSYFGWEPVLIVGEEYLGGGEAEIIRLRFPACDIWNLPFTAHEYGYLVATKNTKVPEEFRLLRDRARQMVKPANHYKIGGRPQKDEETGFLKAVRHEWDIYAGFNDDEKREGYVETEGPRLAALEDQQERYLCRLFADAFATFYIGPAYIHALLSLHFIPERLAKASPYMPPFTDRFVFALETLRWMKHQIASDPAKYRIGEEEPFERELVDDPEQAQQGYGLYELWRVMLRSAGQPDTYQQTWNAYRQWFNTIIVTFQNRLGALEKTYDSWKTACALEPYLIESVLSVPSTVLEAPLKPVSKWVVLNAAWSARWLHPDILNIITDNVQKLFDPSNTNWCKTSERSERQQTGTPKGALPSKEQAIAEIIEALAKLKRFDLAQRMSNMSDKPQEDQEINDVLKENGKGQALLWFQMVVQNSLS